MSNDLIIRLAEEIAALKQRVAELERQERPTALDTADALSTLRVVTSVDDHFRGTSLGAGWVWAGAPFVTPTATLSLSTLRVTALTSAQRAFLYRSSFSTSAWYAALNLTSLSVGYAAGLRLDDGTDNNYVEAVLRVSQSTPTQWQFQVRWRTGGGAISTANGNTIAEPGSFALISQRSGTAWSSWGLALLAQQLPALGGLHWNPNSAVSGLTWTPTRAGIVVDGGGSAAAFNTAHIDWAKLS